MASADFSTNIVEISPGKTLILKVYVGCIYTTMFIGFGLCKDVVTHPHCRASYAVPVRPYHPPKADCFLQIPACRGFRLQVTRNALAAY